MAICINKRNPEYLQLSSYFSDNFDRSNLNAAIGLWQQFNGAEAFPSLGEVLGILDNSGIQYTLVKGMQSEAIPFKIPNNLAVRKLEHFVKNWLKSAGITIKNVDSILDAEGNPINALAQADILEDIIQVIEGKATPKILSEEAIHFFIEMIADSPLGIELLNNVVGSETYQKVVRQYGRAYNGDTLKLQKEAAAKLLTEEVFKVYNEAEGRYALESPSIITKIKRYVDRILENLKSLFKDTTLSSQFYKKEVSPLRQAAVLFLKGEVTTMPPVRTNSKFYHLSSDDRVYRDKVQELLENMPIMKSPEGSWYIRKNDGKRIARLSDLIKAFYLRIYGENEKTDTKESRFFAHKGTVLHKWYEVIMADLIAGRTPEYLTAYENVFKSFLDDEIGMLYQNQDYYDFLRITEVQFAQVVNGLRAIYNQIQHNQEVINKQLGVEGKATIYTEMPIINQQGDLGGTLDLLVLYSNGKVALYDYKNISFRQFKGEILYGISEDKFDDFNMRLTTYKNILYSQGITEFAESRIIPINVNYYPGDKAFKGFRTIEFHGQNVINNEYLEQISVAEELTGLTDLDKNTLQLLYARRNTLKKLYHQKKSTALKAKLDWTHKAIQSLVLRQDFGYIYSEIINQYNNFYDDKNRLSKDPKSLTADDLLELDQIIRLYQDFSATFQASLGDKLTSEQLYQLKDLNQKLQLLKYAIKHTTHDFLLASDPDKIDYTKPGKEYKGLGVWWRKLSEFNHNVFIKLGNWVRTSEMKTNQKVAAAHKIIQKNHIELEKWAKNNNMSTFDAMSKLYDAKAGRLIKRFSPQFGIDLAAARLEADKDFMLKYFYITEERYGPESILTYSGPAKEAFERAKTRLTNYYARRYPNNPELQDRELNRWLKAHDISINKNLIFDKNNQFLYKNFDNMGNYLSPEFKYIRQHKALLDYYTMYTEFNKEFSELTGQQIDNKFVANIRQDFYERLKTAGIFSSNTFKFDLLGSLEARDANNIYADKEVGQAFDVDGSPLYTVPLMYLRPLRGVVTDEERAKIRDEVAKKYSPKTEAILYKAALDSALLDAEHKKGLEDKSRDLTTNLLLMTRNVYNYVHMSEIEGLANLLLLEVKDKKVFTKQDDNNLKILDKLASKVATKFGLPANMESSLESFINMYIYNKTSQDDEKPTVINKIVDENGEVISPGTEIYFSTLVKRAMRWSAGAMLGLKPTLVARNAIQVKLNLWLTTTEKQWFDETHLKAATKSAYSDGKKYMAAVEYFLPYSNDPVYDMAKNLSAKGILNKLDTDLLFKGLRWTDENVDRNILAVMLHSHGIENGRIKQIRYIKSEDRRSLYERMKLDEKTGDVSVDGLTFDQLVRFRNMVQSIGSKIKGTTPTSDRMLINTTLIGALLMQYRSWMPGLVKSHFGGLTAGAQYEPTLDTVDLGRFTVFFNDILGLHAENAKRLAHMLAASIPILGFIAQKNLKTNEAAAREMYQRFKADNPESEYTFEQFIEMRVNKLKAAATEFQAILALLLLKLLAKSLIPDDKEEAPVESFLTRNLYRIIHGAYLEASFFIFPSSFQEIARSPFALLGFADLLGKFATNTADEMRDVIFGEGSKRDITPAFKYTLKLTPGVGGLVDFIDLFDDFNPTKR